MQPGKNAGKWKLVAYRPSETNKTIQLWATTLKNSKENDDDPRQDLLHDVEGAAANQSILRYPELTISIEGIEVKASLDTASEITCISQEFNEKHLNVFKGRSTFPICGKVVKGATGDKTTRLKVYGSVQQKRATERARCLFRVKGALFNSLIIVC